MERSAILAALREIAGLLELRGANRYKVRAFERGARALEASRVPLEVLRAEGRLTELPGIGAARAHQIEELATTGRSALLEELRAGLPSGVLELAQVGGIGLHALETLHRSLGVGSVDELAAAAAAGRLRDVPGFGPKREAKLLDAIAAYRASRPRLLLGDVERVFASLADDLGTAHGVRRVELAGAARRGLEVTDGLVLVVTSATPEATLAALLAHPRFASRAPTGSRAATARLPDGTHVDLVVTPPASAGAALAVATGAAAYVTMLRAAATERGLVLEDEVLRERSGALVATPDEVALHAALGLPLVPPELREPEAPHTDGRLVERGDLRGFVHCHSTWSDGKDDLETLARAAEARGARYLTVTDHSSAAHYAGGLDADRLRRQWDEIARVQEKVRIRLLRGTEADILADGALDGPPGLLEELDVVIASIHARHRQDEDAMTARLLRAMRAPIFKIWGHPLGRLLTSRPPVPCRVEEILDALASSRGAIEINGSPHRLDLEPRWARAAKERGLRFVLSVDAHAVRELDNDRFAVTMARRAGLVPADVLNTLDADAFAAAVRPLPRAAS